jgi:integrase
MASTLNYANTLSPKTARSVLVPPDATDVPAAVMEANRPAVEKVEALERAGQAVRDARRVADDAPRRDQAARVAAHQAGKKLPAPTVANANEAVEIAERTRDLCRRETDGAICHLHEVIATHQREWLDAQEPVTDHAVADLAADVWLEAARAGIVRNRSGETYKPAALRSYDRVLRLHVLPRLGRERLRDVTLPQLQRFVDQLAGDGLAAATITTTITPLRAIYRRARQLGDVHANPTSGVSVPAVDRRQTRFATAGQVEAMLDRLEHAKDRALWATAIYAGLRRGELMALHREEVDLATGVIRVERGWDQCEGEVAPKSKQGRRKVPIPAALRDRLAEYLIDGPDTGRIFVGARDSYDRGRAAAEAAKVEPPTLHQCRHGYAALMIAAGVNIKALSTFMGHANIRITLDQYGHLLPGAEDEAAALLDVFMARQLGGTIQQVGERQHSHVSGG